MRCYAYSTFQIFKVKEIRIDSYDNPNHNIILNSDFSQGLQCWHPNCCDGYVVSEESGYLNGVSANSGGRYAVITNRKECWQGLEQDITIRVSPGSTYTVSACVRVLGPLHGSTGVQATLRLEFPDSATSYLFVGRTSVTKDRWEKLEGTFSLATMPNRVFFYLEGPAPGVDLLIDSVSVSCSSLKEHESATTKCFADDENIILNPHFDDGLNNWSGKGCKVATHDSMGDGKIRPLSGNFFASATERTQSFNGIQQEITGRVQRKLAYEVTAVVRIFGNNVTSADVRVTLWVQAQNQRELYIGIASSQASNKDWVQLQGKFLLNGSPSRVIIYFEGPPPGTDILVNSLIVKHAAKVPPSPPPVIENADFGVNIVENSSLNDGLNGWFPLGNCTMSVNSGSPLLLPPMARDSLGPYEPLSGRYILVTNRTQTWMGPAQMITDKLKLYLTYQVSAWVRVGPGVTTPQNVIGALSVDNQWVNGGQVEANDERWHEIGGSFRIEKQPSKVMVSFQGPSSGVDLMVAGLQIFPVDRQARFKHLKMHTDKIRKRDVILKFTGADVKSLPGTSVRIRQTQNSFSIGSCINRTNIDNEDFVDFFIKNFNFAVFENELKWYWTEPQQGDFNYKDADEILDFCKSHSIECRGHCIFWEVEGAVQSWIQSLNKNDLMTAVQNRLTGLLAQYKDKFRHYDVNNEMLHGSFYQDRLGKDIRAYMFKTAHQLDPSATLFVNDYHVEDGCDTRSSPEKYIEQILDLQQQGASVGGIGIQGHIDSPVGPIVCSALDKLGILGLPIWFTELDVSSINEYVRADDLEAMLREAFAHPSVEGIMLWGFWELFMSRENSHLVDAEGSVNVAGKRYLALKEEWLSSANGYLDDQGEFRFRGFHGTYTIDFTLTNTTTKTFVVDKGESPLELTINL
ncbi:endo-1,4-beta-xylanase 1-like isoform X2 [Telopea speciosissima]|uniref:endo-1,4-beta-xylanase 1-like isoform X2 n=1 Tax=Telopea speciosissima TaxID=54955 RepID=UPI001CC39F97|nr:endo-1,4-beta-xylanase 1-like isoform X2 [Telopea speciosissima]